MPRFSIVGPIAAILEGAPTHEPSGFPLSFTYHELAGEVYGVEDPDVLTAAHLFAVRRAVARLVLAGRAERIPDRQSGGGSPLRGRVMLHRGSERHAVQSPRATPFGVRVRRSMTDADYQSRAVVVARIKSRPSPFSR